MEYLENSKLDYFDLEEEKAVDLRTFLVFEVTGETFAVETSEVVEIVKYAAPTPVPEFPAYVSGIAAIKGRTIPVINTAVRFKFEDMGEHPRKCIIIAKINGEQEREVGILADDVRKIRNVEADKVLPPPDVNSEAFTRYIKGMFIRTNSQPCFVVSPQLMMTEEEKEGIFEAIPETKAEE